MPSHSIFILEDDRIMRGKVFPTMFEDLQGELPDHRFELNSYGTYTSAEKALMKAISKGHLYNLAILDVRLSDHHSNNGLDIAALLRGQCPPTKILFHTSINSRYEVDHILTEFDPDGFLLKSETDYEDLMIAILTLINGNRYHSSTIIDYMGSNTIDKDGLDKLDLSILYYLSVGTVTDLISDALHVSISTVERRKRKMAQLFGIDRVNSQKLVAFAKKNGLI